MRYLLIDHITEWEKGKKMKGIKNVAMSEDFLEFHFPKNPIMPGVMLLEAFIQLAGWLEAVSSDFQNWFFINTIKKSNFYGFALPGDQVELEIESLSGDDTDLRIYRGLGTVKGKKKILAEFAGERIPVQEIEEPEEQKRLFQRLTRELTF